MSPRPALATDAVDERPDGTARAWVREIDAHRRGEVHAAVSALVDRHGLEDVTWALGVCRDDIADAGPREPSAKVTIVHRDPKPANTIPSARTAVTYECEVIAETDDALKLWIPSPEFHLDGEAAWCPRSALVSKTDTEVTAAYPLKWRIARRLGSDRVEFVGEAPKMPRSRAHR